MDDVTSLYTYRDSNKVILYVGITSRRTRRLSEHVTSAAWWRHVATAEFTHFGTRAEAEAAEREVIRRNRPLYNIIGNFDNAEVIEEYRRNGVGALVAKADEVLVGSSNGTVVTLPEPHSSYLSRAIGKVSGVPHRLAVAGTVAKSVSSDGSGGYIVEAKVRVPTGVAYFRRNHGDPWRIDIEVH